MRVLLVEDDERLVRVIKRVLEQEQITVDAARDGPSAVLLAGQARYDAIILDVMLPAMNGIQVSRVLRESGNQSPILMLTALGEVHDKVRGLDAGADDYLTKPFSFDELLARLRALFRRGQQPQGEAILRVGRLQVDLVRHVATLDEKVLDLTPTEFRLLELFMRQPDRVFNRAQIIEQVWGYEFDGNTTVIETYIHYLRNKLKNEAGSPRIQTVRGVGYVLRKP